MSCCTRYTYRRRAQHEAAATTLLGVTDDELREALAATTQEGAAAAERASALAPADPLHRVAWFQGFDDGRLRDAVQAARDAGVTWREIGIALGGKTAASAEAIYGRGRLRGKSWRAKRQQGDEG